MLNPAKIQWLEETAKAILDSARITGDDGTVLYCPDGSDNYRGVWTRDFCYIAENTPDLIPPEHMTGIFKHIIRRQRDDGGVPGSISPDGKPGYCTVAVGDREKVTDGDNSQFLVKIADACAKRTGSLELFEKYFDKLIAAMNFVPRSAEGLVWIDTEAPHTSYGFTDTILKTGHEFFCSILYWEAARILEKACKQLGRSDEAGDFAKRAELIENNIKMLFDEKNGAFLAASVDNRKIDIWGNAYFIYIDFPANDLRAKVLDFLKENYENYILFGQVRHLLRGQYWDRTIQSIWPDHDLPKETYQNGAYWGTASGWVIRALHQVDPALAEKTASALIDYYQTVGIYECVNEGRLWGGLGARYTKIDKYVASAVNPLGALRKIREN